MKKFLPTESRTDFIVNNDVSGEQITVAHSVDITGAAEEAKRIRDALEGKSSFGEEMRPVMELEPIFIEQYCIDKGISWAEFWHPGEHSKHVKALLHDPALSAFRLRRAFITQK